MAASNRIADAFAHARAQNWTSALIPFVCAGDPDLDATEACLTGFPEAGASIVEVGIPFSDPIADGPTIASAMHRALERGTRLRDVLETVKRARSKTDAAFVAMVSCSIAAKFGAPEFARMLADAGFDGVIYPDVPLEESPVFLDPVRALGLTASLLVSPATPDERAARIARASSGFVYAMARVGITGAISDPSKASAPIDIAALDRLREASALPVACGFGISTPEDVQRVAPHADGVIVGSAIVRTMHEATSSSKDPVASATALVRTLAGAAHHPAGTPDALA